MLISPERSYLTSPYDDGLDEKSIGHGHSFECQAVPLNRGFWLPIFAT